MRRLKPENTGIHNFVEIYVKHSFRQLCWRNVEHNRCLDESIERNASIIGRILVPHYKSLLVKRYNHRKRLIYSNRTVSNSNRTIRQLTVLLEYVVFSLKYCCPGI